MFRNGPGSSASARSSPGESFSPGSEPPEADPAGSGSSLGRGASTNQDASSGPGTTSGPGTDRDLGGPSGLKDIRWCELSRVVDGNTLDVEDLDGEITRVRLFGIDAPEKGQPHGLYSMVALYNLVKEGPLSVKVLGTDDFGRPIGRVRSDRQDVGRALVRSGHAWHNPAFGDSRMLRRLQEYAREKGIGLWSGETTDSNRLVPPWKWRRRRANPPWGKKSGPPLVYKIKFLLRKAKGPALWLGGALLALTLLTYFLA